MTLQANLRDAEFRALHALRVKGAATGDDVGRLTGLDDSGDVLRGLETAGLATARDAGGTVYFALSEQGQDVHREAVQHRLDADSRGRIAKVYDERFLDVNVRFKQLCAEWQQENRFDLVEQAVDVHEEITAVLATAAACDERFARYGERLDTTMDAFQEGDASALAAPVGESYHNVWFELHEDLLVTLGRSRADEAA